MTHRDRRRRPTPRRAPGGSAIDAPRPDGGPEGAGPSSRSPPTSGPRACCGAQTLRSPHPLGPHPRHRHRAGAAHRRACYAVLTADDVPGARTYGLEHRDQPVLAVDVVRYQGEPVAVVAADHPETARRARGRDRRRLRGARAGHRPRGRRPTAPPIHPDGNVFRHLVDPPRRPTRPAGPVVGRGHLRGRDAGPGVPRPRGRPRHARRGRRRRPLRRRPSGCTTTATRSPRASACPRRRCASPSAASAARSAAREDVSLQIHACLLALRTGRPVKMVYSREESFLGHVHRHPARIWYAPHAPSADGTLVNVEARHRARRRRVPLVSAAVSPTPSCFAAGPYRVPNAHIDGCGVRTNNPPCGAMRGFGAVQACFAHEAQMDQLAAALRHRPGRAAPAQRAGAPATSCSPASDRPARRRSPRCIRTCVRRLPLPRRRRRTAAEPMALPGRRRAHRRRGDVRRGVGFAVGFKNLVFAEGFDDYSTARVRPGRRRRPRSTCARAAEVGQGFVTLAQQIARTELGVDDVHRGRRPTPSIGSAGSTSASRQTWMSGGAVQGCLPRRSRGRKAGGAGDPTVRRRHRREAGTCRASATRSFEETVEYHHRADRSRSTPTARATPTCRSPSPPTARWSTSTPSSGLVRVVHLATAQDVGKVLNPLQLLGQIEGGIAQGVGLAVMEEIVADRRRSSATRPSPTT